MSLQTVRDKHGPSRPRGYVTNSDIKVYDHKTTKGGWYYEGTW
jgi:hypothetical protein